MQTLERGTRERRREPAGARPPARRALAPRLEVLAAAALFSTGGAAVKATHLSGWPVACLRSAIAAAALVLLLPQVRRRPTPRMLGIAACYAVTMILFVLSNKLTTAASAIYLQASAPLFVLLLSPWLLGERIRRGDLLSMAAIALGMALLATGLEPASSTAPEPWRGNLLAALSGLTWALTIMGMRSLGRAAGSQAGGQGGSQAGSLAGGQGGSQAGSEGGSQAGGEEGAAPRSDGLVAAFWGNVLAAAAALPMSLPLPAVRAADWLVIGFLGLFQIGLAYVLLTRGVGGVPALETSLLLLLEPVLNPLWAWLVHGERVGQRVLAGGALILAATLLNSWHDARLAARERRAAEGPSRT
ncbi:MAG TPA: EamA family transporter [Thermoanaerobaculia bacterium]|nr:EamA family transporter [Thermoanaerobaculia bacterium]